MAHTLASRQRPPERLRPGTAVGENALVTDNDAQDAPTDDEPRVVVIDPAPTTTTTSPRTSPSLVGQPAKVMRIGTMIKQLLDEVRSAPLDDAARARLAEIHERSLHELEEGLSPELVAELHRITLPFVEDQAPSDAELRIAQAQLVGWLEGLFHGIQTALVAQQMAAQDQLDRDAPPAAVRAGARAWRARPGPDGRPAANPSTGQYL